MKTSITLTASENGRYLYIYLPANFAGKAYSLSVDPKDAAFQLVPNRKGIHGVPEAGMAKFFFTKCHHGMTKEQLEAFPKTKVDAHKEGANLVFSVPYFQPLPAKAKDPRSQAAQLIDRINSLLATGDYEAAIEGDKVALYQRKLLKVS